jgi:hypothetical protein
VHEWTIAGHVPAVGHWNMVSPARISRAIAPALAMSLLLVGASCSGSGGGAAVAPASVEHYDTTVGDQVASLNSALEELAKAKAYKGLGSRVSAVEAAADQAATDLREIAPPAELATEHAQLVAALEAFHDDLGDLSSQVKAQALCTGSAVRARLGDADASAGLRGALTAVGGKLPGKEDALALPAAGQKPGQRPKNGEILRSGKLDGYGELTIKNGGSDAVVTLTKKKDPVVSVYIRGDKEATVKGVRDGSYTVFFTSGGRWDGKVRAFGRDCTFQRSEKKSEFETTDTSYTILTYTLYKVAGGNAPTKDVDPGDFPE